MWKYLAAKFQFKFSARLETMVKFFLCFILLVSPKAFLSTPVFLEDGGSKLCTLNTIGMIPDGVLERPVYQKVCRQVIPTLGDYVDDSSEQGLSDEVISSSDDDQGEKVHRAILGISKKKEKAQRRAYVEEKWITKVETGWNEDYKRVLSFFAGKSSDDPWYKESPTHWNILISRNMATDNIV